MDRQRRDWRRTTMSMRTLCWLIAAIAIAAATLGLSALIVAFVPNDPNAAAAAVQQQVIEPKLESIVESHRRTR
jgi:hypothetical protein